MSDSSILNDLSELEIGEAGQCFMNVIRKSVNQAILNVLSEEVLALCGPKHEQGVSRENYRNGSKEISYNIAGVKDTVKKPRVRKNLADGGTQEVPLKTSEEIQKASNLEDIIVRMLSHGTSTRDVSVVLDTEKSVSKSHVSRLLAVEGSKQLKAFRSRDLSTDEFLVLMIDGIRLSSNLWIIAAIGITETGDKKFLDFEVGSSESNESASALVAKLCNRGFKAPHGLLCVFDGSKALKHAVYKHFPNAIIQRCLIHKERNIKGCLSKKNWGELSRLFKALRECQGDSVGREKLNDIKIFLKDKNQAAYDSLLEADEELIALHNLNVPSTLNASLLNTNIIENSFRNVRTKIGRVTRWREETSQASNWMALAIMHIEKGFRRIKGYAYLGDLKKALRDHKKGKK